MLVNKSVSVDILLLSISIVYDVIRPMIDKDIHTNTPGEGIEKRNRMFSANFIDFY